MKHVAGKILRVEKMDLSDTRQVRILAAVEMKSETIPRGNPWVISE